MNTKTEGGAHSKKQRERWERRRVKRRTDEEGSEGREVPETGLETDIQAEIESPESRRALAVKIS